MSGRVDLGDVDYPGGCGGNVVYRRRDGGDKNPWSVRGGLLGKQNEDLLQVGSRSWMSIREESVVFAGRRGEDVDVEGACTRKVGERSKQLVPQTHLEWLKVKAMSSSQRP